MSSGVYGDTKRLDGIFKGLGLIESPVFRAALNRQLAEEARAQVVESFERSEDPYGRPWKPSGRGGQTLRHTGRLLSSIAPSWISHSGFRLSTNVKYAAIHNYGGIIKAKTSKGLRFQIRIGTTFIGARGKRLKRTLALKRWVRLMQVRIPRRTFIPIDGRLGKRWTRAFREVAVMVTEDAMGSK
jgi:phage gpG-like protein